MATFLNSIDDYLKDNILHTNFINFSLNWGCILLHPLLATALQMITLYCINFHYYMCYEVRLSVPKAVLNSSTKRKKGACTMTRRRPRPIESTGNFSKLIIQYTD